MVDLKNIPNIPSPKLREPVNLSVDKELYDQLKQELKSRKIKIREVVEWGFKTFLLKLKEEEKKYKIK